MSANTLAASTASSAGNKIRRLLPGLALALALGIAGLLLAGWAPLQRAQISALTIAIVLGMTVGNSFGAQLPAVLSPGVLFAQQKLLRLGVILYGLRISFGQIAAIGPAGLAIDAIVVVGTLALASTLGRRLFGLDRDSALLTGVGSAICGAAAVLALERVLKPDPAKVAIAVATVVLFGTLDIFLYPALYPYLHMDAAHFGLYTGATVHEVAQVIAVGSAVDPATADSAVVVKLTRVMLLVPVLFFFGWRQAKLAHTAGGEKSKVPLPWFALVFVAVSALNSVVAFPPEIKGPLLTLDTLLLAVAMAALGLETRVAKLRALGPKPLLLAVVLWMGLIAGGALLVRFFA
ncbi:YeiH family protein [Rudaea sp.]|uniref:YeiH family protein n=1 Tax=Rudaea sp. TaxID=2136325 RepID=UPI0032206AAB